MLTRENLYPYQGRAVQFAKDVPNCMLMMDMGLGKTVSVCTAYRDLRNTFDVRRMLVSAPLRVARKVWSDEVQEWSHLQGLKVVPIVGTEKQRLDALNTEADIHTINREQMMWLEDQFLNGSRLLRKWPWDVIAHDESQSYKNSASQRYQSARRLGRLADRVICMTGTPSPNGYIDLWSQYFLLDRGARLGHGIGDFRDRWFDSVQQDAFTKWMPRPHAEAEIRKLIADITLSMRAEDYLELPEVKNNFVRVALSPAVMAKYRKLEQSMIIELGGKALAAKNSGALMMKLMQLSNGAVYDALRMVHEIHKEKLFALEELLDGIFGKAIIAYAFEHDIPRVQHLLMTYCKGTGRKWTMLRSDRQFAAWARGEYDYGLLHPASAGHGLNDVYKSGCKDLVWFGGTNNLEHYKQLNARLIGGHRRGLNMVIHHLVCDETIDVKLIANISRKDASMDGLTRGLVDYIEEIMS